MDKRFAHLIYEFENFRLDVSQLMLSRDGEDIALPPKAIETLLVLVEHRGKVVSKDNLLEAVWQDVIVEESNLYGYLHLLRNALGDQENGMPFIETLRRRGYRFNGDVRVVNQNADSRHERVPPISDQPTIDQNRKSRRVVLAAVCAIVGIVLATAVFIYLKTESPINETSHAAGDGHPESLEVRRHCIRGHDLLQRLTPDFYKQAIDSFEQAKALDPNDPCSYVGIATANRVNMLATDASPASMMPAAKDAALKAVELAPDLAEAQIALGMVTFFHDWDWEAAEEQLRRGHTLNPNSENANIQLAHFYSNMGRHEDAIQLSKRAFDLKPDSRRNGALHGMILFYAGNYDESIERLKELIEFDPKYGLAHFNLQRPYLEKGMYEDALNEGELATSSGFVSLELIVQRAYAYAMMGKIMKSRQALAELEKIAQDGRHVGPYLFAIIYNGLGDDRRAIRMLEDAYKVGDWRMTFLKVDPRLDNLRSEPRFKKLIREMNFE